MENHLASLLAGIDDSTARTNVTRAVATRLAAR
jgi:hypothetical protein